MRLPTPYPLMTHERGCYTQRINRRRKKPPLPKNLVKGGLERSDAVRLTVVTTALLEPLKKSSNLVDDVFCFVFGVFFGIAINGL